MLICLFFILFVNNSFYLSRSLEINRMVRATTIMTLAKIGFRWRLIIETVISKCESIPIHILVSQIFCLSNGYVLESLCNLSHINFFNKNIFLIKSFNKIMFRIFARSGPPSISSVARPLLV